LKEQYGIDINWPNWALRPSMRHQETDGALARDLPSHCYEAHVRRMLVSPALFAVIVAVVVWCEMSLLAVSICATANSA